MNRNSEKKSEKKGFEKDPKKSLKVGLFIPCYINEFYPEVAIKTYTFLKDLGYEVIYPTTQTCCGQPLANAGYNYKNQKIYQKWYEEFRAFDYIVAPSASCVYHLKKYFFDSSIAVGDGEGFKPFLNKIYELTEFLLKVHKLKKLDKVSDYKRIGVHQGCHSLRGLSQGSISEIITPKPFSYQVTLLNMLKSVQVFLPERRDECCGFGGLFSVEEGDVSNAMGLNRIDQFQRGNVEVICSSDMSCLMHLAGIIKKNKFPLATKHIIELIA